MMTVVRFSPDLGPWLVEQLDRGCLPAQVVQMMVAQRMQPQAAQAIVDAFVEARSARRPLPVDSVTMPDNAKYFYEAPILPAGLRLHAGDRTVPVLARIERPQLAVLGDVLSADECAQLIELARPRLRPSTVVDPVSGKDVVAGHRSSYGMFFRLAENELIARLDRRLSTLMNLPLENGEGLQVLHYKSGAQSAPHFDFLQSANAANQASIARSGQRVSTLITYLNEPEDGGETSFPEINLKVAPHRGNAVYFEYCNASGQVDPQTLHGSLPIVRGEKWVLTKWMRQRRFVPASDAESAALAR